jgi:hypothetical protein
MRRPRPPRGCRAIERKKKILRPQKEILWMIIMIVLEAYFLPAVAFPSKPCLACQPPKLLSVVKAITINILMNTMTRHQELYILVYIKDE